MNVAASLPVGQAPLVDYAAEKQKGTQALHGVLVLFDDEIA
jgi:hypothetical protein